MYNMKTKMSVEKKTKLIYSGELIIIALIALVIGILKLVGVIDTKPVRLLVYNIISLVGAVIFIGNFVWALVSPKKRKKTSMLDSLITLPVMLYLIGFDIYCFVIGKDAVPDIIVKYSVGLVLIYIGIDYIFQGIYHYFYLTPQLAEAIKEEEDRLLEEAKQVETPSDIPSEEKQEDK